MNAVERPTAGVRWSVRALATIPSAAAGVIGTSLVAAWRDDLPDPVATHWGSDGVDGYSGLGFVTWSPLVVGLVAAVIGLIAVGRVIDRTLARVVVGTIAGVSISVIATAVATAWVQRGAVDASTVDVPNVEIVASLLVGLLCALAAAALVPGWPTVRQPDTGMRPAPMELGDDERVVWVRSVSTPGVLWGVLAALVIVALTVTLVLRAWPAGVIVVVALIPMAMFSTVRVRVDRTAVTIRGALGWPRIRIPMDQIDHATVVPVRALRDFGGFGYRVAVFGEFKGAKGFVLRSGPALLLTRTDGRREIIVVDQAETAAALVNRVRGQQESGAGPQTA